jgi:hypothetical protein
MLNHRGTRMIRKGIAVGIILLLFVGTSISVAYDTSTDEIPHQSVDMYFLNYAFVWGTYENCTKNWIGNFNIWNREPWFNLTIHVIGNGPYGTNDEDIWMNVEAHNVIAQHHLGIIGPHKCCIFAFGWLGVTVMG